MLIRGTNAPLETLPGTNFADKIYALGGANWIYAYNGNDTIYGGAGFDLIYGGNGNDSIYGDGGHDQIYGGNGNDTIYGGAGQDRIEGGAGNDIIYGGDHMDLLHGGAGNDILDGGWSNDALNGGGGDDRLLGGPGADRFTGGAGNDYLDLGANDGASDTIKMLGNNIGKDTVVNFEDGIDKINIGSKAIWDFMDVNRDGVLTNGDWGVSVQDDQTTIATYSGSLTIMGRDIHLDQSDFLFG
jgi:Ca2+-binding RTX toxin-like protein